MGSRPCPPECTCKRHGPRPQSVRDKISASKQGHSVSPETRRKIAVSLQGRTPSAETRAKLRARTTHGHSAAGVTSREYRTWSAMIQRCTNPRYDGYRNYGGRGIEVCERWRTFANFLADMGPRPDGTSLDRVNNDGNYEPGNCRWATRSEQNSNQRAARRTREERSEAAKRGWITRRGADSK